MTMQTDVKAKYINATGALGNGGRTRIKAIYILPTASTVGSVSITDGNGGAELLKIENTSMSATTARWIYNLIPGEGVLFQNEPYITLTNITSVNIFYG